MQPPIKASAQEMVEKGYARFGERAVICNTEHLHTDKLLFWFRLKGVFDTPPQSVWTDPDGNVQRGKGFSPPAMAQMLGATSSPREVNWLVSCRSCLDAVSGDRTKICPEGYIELSDKPQDLPTPDFR